MRGVGLFFGLHSEKLFVDLPLFEIILSVFFGDLADHLAGISRGERPIGNVLGDDAARTDHGVVADMNTGADHDISADPHVVADGNADAVFAAAAAHIGMERVSRGIQRYVGGDQAIVSDPDLGVVENDTVVIGEEVFAHFDIASVVAVKRRIDKGRLVRSAKKLVDDGTDLFKIRSVRCVQRLRQAPRFFHLHPVFFVGDKQQFFFSALRVVHTLFLCVFGFIVA